MTTLRRIYRRAHVKRKAVNQEKKASSSAAAMHDEQCRKALEQLKQAEIDGLPVIYLDETVFTRNSLPKIEWSGFKSSLKIDQSAFYSGFRTAIVAVSAELGLVHYESVEQTTNADRFIPFVRALSEKMQAEPFVLYMDNLSVHKMLTVKAVYTELEIVPVFNVAYQPDFNAIEACFARVKAKYKQARLNALVNDEPFAMDAAINSAFQVITPELVVACANRSLGLLKKAAV